ncbi:MAG: CNNM domain-containing protein [Armatimonadaceae bacterium]
MEPYSSSPDPDPEQRFRSRKSNLSVNTSLTHGGLTIVPVLTLLVTVVLLLAFRFAAAQEVAAEEPRLVSTGNYWLVLAAGLGIVFLLTLIKGAFSLAETAFITVRRVRLEQLAESGNKSAQTALRLVESPQRYIATVQMGATLFGFASAAVAAVTLLELTAMPSLDFGVGDFWAKVVCLALVVLLAFLFSTVLGEVAPKALALQAPDRWVLRLASFVQVSSLLFAPLAPLVVGISNLLVGPFGAKARFETPLITREEFEHIIDEGEQHGELDDEEAKILTNVFDLSETSVRSVMTPRIDMTALPLNSSLSRILETVLESGHSRIPVYEDTIDTVVGVVHAKDLLAHINISDQEIDLASVMRKPYFVPESKRVSELLTEMRRDKQQMAIVQDEYAGTEGIVTIEDLLEEIVGEIKDEYDVDEPDIQAISEDEALIDGRMGIADVNDRLGLQLPHKEYNTIGGLVFGLLGHEPMLKERVQVGEIEFQVEEIAGRSIRLVRAIRQPVSPAEPVLQPEEEVVGR